MLDRITAFIDDMLSYDPMGCGVIIFVAMILTIIGVVYQG
jgi:hypothetical protein